MPGTDELMARLQQLEDGYYGDKEAARQKKFFEDYGERFSNDHGLGMAILNELDARGIDTSAADEAVGQILDQLRTECNELLGLLKGVQDAVKENQEKIDTIKGVVDEQTDSNPEASMPPGDPAGIEGVMPPTDMSADTGALPPEGGDMPPVDAGAMPPEGDTMGTDTGVMTPEGDTMGTDTGVMTPEGGEMPPPDTGMVPPGQTVSDARLKRVQAAYSKVKTRRANSYKPSQGILAAAQGGF